MNIPMLLERQLAGSIVPVGLGGSPDRSEAAFAGVLRRPIMERRFLREIHGEGDAMPSRLALRLRSDREGNVEVSGRLAPTCPLAEARVHGGGVSCVARVGDEGEFRMEGFRRGTSEFLISIECGGESVMFPVPGLGSAR